VVTMQTLEDLEQSVKLGFRYSVQTKFGEYSISWTEERHEFIVHLGWFDRAYCQSFLAALSTLLSAIGTLAGEAI
jgi:hypothetical protein